MFDAPSLLGVVWFRTQVSKKRLCLLSLISRNLELNGTGKRIEASTNAAHRKQVLHSFALGEVLNACVLEQRLGYCE